MRNRTTKITFPIFSGYEVRVIVARDIIATGRRLKEDLRDTWAAYVTKDDIAGIGWLVLQADADPGLISHEASHAIRALAAFLGTEFDEETFAHHLGYLVGRVHKFLNRDARK